MYSLYNMFFLSLILIFLYLCRLHPEELGGPPLKKLKQEVGFPGCM